MKYKYLVFYLNISYADCEHQDWLMRLSACYVLLFLGRDEGLTDM